MMYEIFRFRACILCIGLYHIITKKKNTLLWYTKKYFRKSPKIASGSPKIQRYGRDSVMCYYWCPMFLFVVKVDFYDVIHAKIVLELE